MKTDEIIKWTGSPYAFGIALCIIIVWAIAGPFCNFNNTWQLIINTSTTIITFLMVFLVQRAQNKDSLAIHTKLNELIRAIEQARNDVIDIEDLSEEQVEYLHERYRKIMLEEQPLPSELHITEGAESAKRTKEELKVEDGPNDKARLKSLLKENQAKPHEDTK